MALSLLKRWRGNKGKNKMTAGLAAILFAFITASGAAVGAIIHGLVPTEWISSIFGEDNWWLIPIASIIGIPLYIRLSSMIPISQILIMKGMALGHVMAMMISSAGASLPEIVLLRSIFKKELIILFVLSIITMSTVSGYLFYFI
jgi:uncharacterized protein